MLDLFESANQRPRTLPNVPRSDRLTSNVIVLVFFYFAIGAGVLFALHWLLPPGSVPRYYLAYVSLGGAFWLFNKFRRRG